MFLWVRSDHHTKNRVGISGRQGEREEHQRIKCLEDLEREEWRKGKIQAEKVGHGYRIHKAILTSD